MGKNFLSIILIDRILQRDIFMKKNLIFTILITACSDREDKIDPNLDSDEDDF